ncbi:MAG TPA: energy-coupling factor ABC transporter permease [Longimicrobiales bacterium]|nr:energy-coupling factor ABC transporter permease [Longimicrobiales bacterium]
MHIADGIIATEALVAANAVCVGALYLTGRRADPEEIPRMGFVGAALFAVSLLHFPLAGTSVHPSLLGLAGILLGRRVVPVLFVVLLFQALLFQHGGFLSVGLNSLNMAAGALAASLIWRSPLGGETARAALAGSVAVLIPAILMGVEFMLSGYGRGMLYLLSVYWVVAVVEGVLAVTAVRFFRTAQPGILEPEPT